MPKISNGVHTCFDVFKIIPTPIISTTKCDPPWLINGKGIPLKGSIPIMEPRLIKACNEIQKPIPKQAS